MANLARWIDRAQTPLRSVRNSSQSGAQDRDAVVFLCPSQRHRVGKSRSLFMGGKAQKYNTRKGNTARPLCGVLNFPPSMRKSVAGVLKTSQRIHHA